MILAYDFGTGGIKAALFAEDGRCVRDAFAGYGTLYPASGMHEQRPSDWWRAVVDSTRALGDVSSVTAIGISGHSLGVVPIDAKGTLLREAVPIWSDARATVEAEAFGADDAWYLKTGCGFPAGLYSVFKLMWFRTHEPDWFGRTATVLGTKDWINFKLTGVRATDNSYASGTGVYDLVQRQYDADLIVRSGIPASLFPEIVPATHVLGEVLPSVAAELGLPSGVKVVAGGVDNSCMALGAGAFANGRAYASLGSSAWIAISGDKPVLDVRTKPYVFDHVVPGQYASALAIFSAGTSLTWLRDTCYEVKSPCGPERPCTGGPRSVAAVVEGGNSHCFRSGTDATERVPPVSGEPSVYSLIDAEAAASPVGANGLVFNPSLAGGSSLDPARTIRGGFANLELRHTRGDLARAVMEGVAFGLKVAKDELGRQVPLAEPLILTGGGAKAALWRQIYADVFGCSVVASAIGQQCAALGAAALAAVGTGLWNDFGRIAELAAKGGASVNPIDANVTAYRRLEPRHRSLTRHFAEWANDQQDVVTASGEVVMGCVNDLP